MHALFHVSVFVFFFCLPSLCLCLCLCFAGAVPRAKHSELFTSRSSPLNKQGKTALASGFRVCVLAVFMSWLALHVTWNSLVGCYTAWGLCVFFLFVPVLICFHCSWCSSFIMPHTKGYRACTRHMFKKDFKTNGVIPLGRYLQVYKVR